MKIGQKLKQYEEAGSTYFSFEFFPPKTPAGVANLYDRVERLSKLEPAFIDITWGAGGSTWKLPRSTVRLRKQRLAVSKIFLPCAEILLLDRSGGKPLMAAFPTLWTWYRAFQPSLPSTFHFNSLAHFTFVLPLRVI